MNRMMHTLVVCVATLLSATVLMGRSGGAPVPSAGVPTDMGGRDCAACHRPAAANSDSSGRLSLLLDAMTYRPGVKQTIRVRLEHPEARRWGLQLYAHR